MKLTLGGHEYTLTDRRNAFINPATADVYEWEVNPDYQGDTGNEKKRAITETANTANTGLIKQEGAAEGMVLKRSGTILTVTQEEAFWRFFQLCQEQTIYFVEGTGDAYEVQITDYNPKRVGTGGPSKNGKGYYVKYDIEMLVFKFLAGVAFNAGVAP